MIVNANNCYGIIDKSNAIDLPGRDDAGINGADGDRLYTDNVVLAV